MAVDYCQEKNYTSLNNVLCAVTADFSETFTCHGTLLSDAGFTDQVQNMMNR